MENGKYAAIRYLPHHISKTRSPISPLDRAGQFSPFAALSGFGEAIEASKQAWKQRDADTALP